MPRFTVTYDVPRTAEIDVEAPDAEQAEKIARHHPESDFKVRDSGTGWAPRSAFNHETSVETLFD